VYVLRYAVLCCAMLHCVVPEQSQVAWVLLHLLVHSEKEGRLGIEKNVKVVRYVSGPI
jgi:hypothetical protein